MLFNRFKMEPTKTGKIPLSIPAAGKECFTTYKIYGELSATTTPLICLHGGPGVPHYYIEPIGALAAKTNIPVVFYDQIGCGESTHLPEKNGDTEFWTPELFIGELENLIKALGIGKYDLLGQSWGGILAVRE
jgi:proline-specific peptidase